MPRLQRASAKWWCILSFNYSVIRVACYILTSACITENGSEQCTLSPWWGLQCYTGGGFLTPPVSIHVKMALGGRWGQIYFSTYAMSCSFVPGPEVVWVTVFHRFLVASVNSHISGGLTKAQEGSTACPKSWDLSFMESVSVSKFPNLWDAIFSSESELMPSPLVCLKTCTHTDVCAYVYIYACMFVCIYLSLYVCIYLSQVIDRIGPQ